MLLQWGQYYLFTRYLKPGEAVLIDGGVVHFSLPLFTSEYEAATIDDIREYIERLPQSDLLIFVNVPFEVCLKRVNERKRVPPKRLRSLPPNYIFRFIKNQVEAVNYAAQAAKQYGWKIRELDNLESIDKTSGRMMDFLKDMGA